MSLRSSGYVVCSQSVIELCPDSVLIIRKRFGRLLVQVVGVLSAEGLITMERVTLDGTKIKANASGNTFRRKEKIEAHLAAAQTQLEKMNEQTAEEEKVAKRQAAAKQRAARERVTRLESALREVERLQKKKKEDKAKFVARASATDAEAHVMRNGEGGTVPSYNVQLVTDTAHGFVVNVEATTDAIDYRQLKPALDRCEETLGRLPKQLIADGDYTNHAAVQAAAKSGVRLLRLVARQLEADRVGCPGAMRGLLQQCISFRCEEQRLPLPSRTATSA